MLSKLVQLLQDRDISAYRLSIEVCAISPMRAAQNSVFVDLRVI